ncbi:MAG: AAA family ATPase, partial [Anaerolineae bacterium]|nr:AAA family ATPase [Anaerolineae bacterium]
HNPEVIVIDEIGRELEAQAARTIAERGVQLIGTAHGTALDNLLLNPTLSDLIGGIQAVTLSDEEARRRGTQKTVLERKSPPTFDVLIEIQTRDRLIVHEDVAAAVDAMLRGKPLQAELRYRNENGEIMYEPTVPDMRLLIEKSGSRNGGRRNGYSNGGNRLEDRGDDTQGGRSISRTDGDETRGSTRVYAYGVARNRMQQASRRLHVPLHVTDDAGQADVIVTLKNYYRRRPKLIVDAERRGTPIYVLRANTISQMENFIADMFNLEAADNDIGDPFEDAMREARSAIMRVQGGNTQFVDLTPQDAHIRRIQHQMARKARLESESYGEEPERRVRISRRAG